MRQPRLTPPSTPGSGFTLLREVVVVRGEDRPVLLKHSPHPQHPTCGLRFHCTLSVHSPQTPQTAMIPKKKNHRTPQQSSTLTLPLTCQAPELVVPESGQPYSTLLKDHQLLAGADLEMIVGLVLHRSREAHRERTRLGIAARRRAEH